MKKDLPIREKIYLFNFWLKPDPGRTVTAEEWVNQKLREMTIGKRTERKFFNSFLTFLNSTLSLSTISLEAVLGRRSSPFGEWLHNQSSMPLHPPTCSSHLSAAKSLISETTSTY
jgi:hypothetical protein